MKVQECTIKDFNEIKTVFKKVFTIEPWNDDWSNEKQLDAYILDLMDQKNSLTFGFYDKDQLIGISLGHIKHWYEGTEYYIDEFCILKNAQSNGYGTKFMEYLEIELYKRDIKNFFLLTDKDVPAYSFYKKLGFHELEMNVAFTKKVDPFTFEKACLNDVPYIFQLIQERMKWMDEKNIKAWNVMDYDLVYPIEYYNQMCQKGLLYVLKYNQEIASAAVIKEQDERWKENDSSYYIHNFVSKVSSEQYGTIFLKKVEEKAKRSHKMYIRLDSAKDNVSLTKFYESLGFQAVGTCEDGPYQGILRQKKIYS